MDAVIGLIFLFMALAIVVVEYGDDESSKTLCGLCLACFLLSALGGLILGYKVHERLTIQHPSAIEVYQGKTTLEVTYKDSIAIDSVVVYKETN